jgi:hypothetical protein
MLRALGLWVRAVVLGVLPSDRYRRDRNGGTVTRAERPGPRSTDRKAGPSRHAPQSELRAQQILSRMALDEDSTAIRRDLVRRRRGGGVGAPRAHLADEAEVTEEEPEERYREPYAASTASDCAC